MPNDPQYTDPNPGISRSLILDTTLNDAASRNGINQIRGLDSKGSLGSGIPKHVTNVGASVAQAATGTTSTVRVTFHRDPSDKNYSAAGVWVKGYQGNNNPVQVAQSYESPATFVLNNTGEPVSILVQSAGNGGQAPLSSAPTTGITLPKSTIAGYGTGTTVAYTPASPQPTSASVTTGYGYFLGAQSLAPVALNAGGSAASATAVANQVFGCELYLEAAYTIKKVATSVTTGNGVSQSFTSGIYDSTGTTKLIDAGANAFDITASQRYREVTLGTPVTLSPGTYLWVAGANGTTGGSVVAHLPVTWMFDLINGVTLGTPTLTRAFTAANPLSSGALPSTLGALTAFTHLSNIAMPVVIFET